MSGANDRTGVGSGNASYETPDALYMQMDRRSQFTYDPFASLTNYKCPKFSTLDGTFEVRDGEIVQIDERDGLNYPWRNERVFCNPPFSRGLLAPCVQKMAAEVLLPLERSPQIVSTVLPASTDTIWYHQHVAPYANIDFLRGRVHFIHPPFECGPKCQVPNKDGKVHAFGEPLTSPPGALLIAEYRTKWRV